MNFESLIALALATMVLGLAPGPAVFATLARALSIGVTSTYIFIAGIVVGDFLFAMLAMMGLAEIASNYTSLFMILKIIGAGYLIYLGIKSWNVSVTPSLELSFEESKVSLFTSGFFLTCGNPKDLLFFVVFLPSFVDLSTAKIGGGILVAALTVMVVFTATLSVFVLGAQPLKKWLQKEKHARWLHRISGITMILVGCTIIFS